MTIQIADVRLGNHRDDIVVVKFKDGHSATFVENQGGWGIPTTLERFWLEHGQTTIAMYNSPRQYPINHTPFGLVKLAKGYTKAQVAAYWKAALDYIVAAQRQGRLEKAFWIITKGTRDINELYNASAS